jgi:hypothetical protein
MSLARLDENAFVSRLYKGIKGPEEVAFEDKTPFTGPWRVIAFGTNRASLSNLDWVKSLKP